MLSNAHAKKDTNGKAGELCSGASSFDGDSEKMKWCNIVET